MTAAEFKPDLLQDVKTYFFGIATYSCNPNLCASESAARISRRCIAQYKPTVTMQVPQWGVWYGRFGQTQDVAWLQFPDGAVVNCGVLASWWIQHPENPALAYSYAEMEIKGVIAAKDAEGQ